MRAMILAAGLGERLRPLTLTVPKPLVLIKNKPLIFYHIENLARSGITEIIINVHHLAEVMISTIGFGEKFGVKIHYSFELELLGSGGGVLQALPLLGSEPFLLINADIFTDFPYEQLMKKVFTSLAHLVLVKKPCYFNKGDFNLYEESVLLPEENQESYIFSGISVLHPELFQGQTQKQFNLTTSILYPLIDKKSLKGELYSGFWHEIATEERLNLLKETLNFKSSTESSCSSVS